MVKDPKAAALPGWLARIYPFSPAAFRTPQGASMSYLDEGPRHDEAVLMLHGNPTWSFYYRSLVRALSGSMRCIAPDHIGMGLSEKPESYAYTLASRIADVEALADSLGLRKIHLVVHDWGGAIGFGLAVRRPDRIGRIVIMNTAAFPSPRIPVRIALCRAPFIGAFIVRGLNGFAEPATFMAMSQRRLTWDERRAYLYPYGSWANRIGVHRFVRDIPMEPDHPSRAVLDGIARALPSLAGHRKLIVWGARDFCFDESFLAAWRELYPDAQLHLLERTGHYVLEDGGPLALEPICTFLKKTSPL
jgi:pimeloyl-ACP methyl ester carboxylesterase